MTCFVFLNSADSIPTPSASSPWSDVFHFWWRSFANALKLFTIGYAVIKPLIRRKLQSPFALLWAIFRSSAWVSLAGVIVFVPNLFSLFLMTHHHIINCLTKLLQLHLAISYRFFIVWFGLRLFCGWINLPDRPVLTSALRIANCLQRHQLFHGLCRRRTRA